MTNNNFNFLRFYFAFVVVIGHLIGISKVEGFRQFAPFFNTYTSVTAFFCISGFLITRSYLNSSSYINYLLKRAARLLPAYILVVILSAVFLSFLSRYSFSDYYTHPQFTKYLIANLSFANFVQPCLPGVFLRDGLTCDVNGALWTLKVEVSFYLTIPVLLFLIKKSNNKPLIFIIIYLFSVIYKNSFEYLTSITGNGIYSILARQLPGFLSYFICGIALYYYFEFFLRNKKLFFIVGFVLFTFEQLIDMEIFTPIALPLMVFAIAFSFSGLNTFAKYGDFSYGIYLFHCPIIKIAKDLDFFERYNPLIVAITIILFVLFLGVISWHFIEKKFLLKLHKAK
ncbi:MAG: acyltransferase family protein [Bacteroidia bacterium]